MTGKSARLVILFMLIFGLGLPASTAAIAADLWTKKETVTVRLQHPQEMGGRSAPIEVDYRVTIRTNGAIDAEVLEVREIKPTPDKLESYKIDPLEWQWNSFKLTPQIANLTVLQSKDPKTGAIVQTTLSAWFDIKATGKAIPRSWRPISTVLYQHEHIVLPNYHRPKPLEVSAGSIGVSISSDVAPRLNTVAKEKFRSGSLQASDYNAGQNPTGDDEIPNRFFVNEVVGEARLRTPGGNWLQIGTGWELYPGDTIKTLQGTVEIVLPKTALLKIKPYSQLVVPADENTKVDVGFIKLVSGFLWARAKKPSLRVATPHGGCSVRGTEFDIEYSYNEPRKRSETWCEVYEGKVLLEDHEGSSKGPKVKSRLLTRDGISIASIPETFPFRVWVHDLTSGVRKARVEVTPKGQPKAKPIVVETGDTGMALVVALEPGEYLVKSTGGFLGPSSNHSVGKKKAQASVRVTGKKTEQVSLDYSDKALNR